MKLSIVTIHYQSPEMIGKLIQSCVKDAADTFDLEFLVIDNSGDYVHSLGVPVRLIKPGYNSGFARGVNAGLRAATGDYVVVINQDAYLHEPNTFARLLEQAQKLPRKTVLSCRILDENGDYQQSIWLDNPGVKRVWRFGAINYKLHQNWKVKFDQQTNEIHNYTGYVPRVNGAFFILRNDKYVEDAYFDEDFFLYGEDIEWALRIRKKRWKFFYSADTSIRHIGGASSPNSSLKKLQILLMDWLVVRKIYGKHYFLLYIHLLRFNLLLDLFLYRLYLIRKGVNPSNEDNYQKDKQLMIRYLHQKYKRTVASSIQLSSVKSFKLNCYLNDTEFSSEKKE